MSNYCNGPYIHLGVYINKVLSAWTEVWSGTWPSTASITAPEGLDDFSISGRPGDIQFSLFEGRFGRMRLERIVIRHDIRRWLYFSARCDRNSYWRA